ncbi:MAG: LytTR family DNA-binding domain-containing protein [Eubacteriales bacterium]|nr:LytTR family DNA-binding domain-containing protein [Eubacteriales bacterium]
MYYVGICDDGENICSELEKMVLSYAKEKKLELGTESWNTGEALCEYLRAGNPLDVLFLDIELFRLSGIEVGRFIRGRLEDRRLQIVYISGKASYAQSLFKTQPLDFLIKPVLQAQVNEVLALAVTILGKNETRFEYQSGRDYCYLPYGDIMYFISEGRKIRIVTVNGTREFYGKLKELEKELPAEFLKIHQSYLVHTAFVARYAYEEVELTDGTMLSISKKYRKQVRERLMGSS